MEDEPYGELIPIAKRFQKELGEICNRKFKGGAVQAVTVATMMFRNMLIGSTRRIHEPGGPEGRDFIIKVYDSAKADALLDWEKK